ncbi:MAG: beta strand repeat-containing protein, partial [Ignavibacteria bacterium]
MKRLFTLLVIFTFFVSALSVAQIQKKGETKKDKQIEKVNQRDPGIKDFDNRKLMFEQNQTKNPLFMNPPTMSPNALVTIGTGTSTQRWPFERYYNYSTCEMIYLQSEIAMSGNITKIGFNKSAGTNTAAMTNVSIYMKHTSSTTLASGNYDLTGYSLVYSGSYTNNATSGWMEVTLATGFNYDNVNNLQILVIKGNQTYLTTAASPKYYYTTGTSRMRNGYSDTGQPLALTASTANPNVRFNITPSSSPSLSCTPSSLAFGYVQSGGTSSTMTYSLSGTNLTAGPIVVTAPTNFEVSLDGSTWASSVNVTYTAPTLASTTIYTHFKPTSPNTAYSGNITNVGGGTSINVAVTGNSYMYARYCTSNATDFADEDIFNVTLGSINNASDCNTTAPGPGSIKNQYSNYTTTVTPTNLAQGSANAFSVSSGTCGGNYGNGFKIFIDFNQDGDFADAGEEVYVSAVAGGGPHTETGYITVPGGATLGNTMMRVINVETTTPSTITACGTYYWGETEDYTVNIIAGSPMSYSSSDVIQIGRPAPLSTTNNQILKIPVVVSGLLSPYSITDFNLGINGTTTASDISVARIYYTGTSSTFATTTQFGNFSNPTGDYTINGSQLLTPGTNYFWVAYDLSGTATLNNQLDGQCYSIVGDGTMGSVNPTNTDPAGVSYIDNYCYGTTTTDPTGYGLNISNVTIGTINSTTGSTGIMPYMNNNYTNLSTDITQGATVPISLSRTGTVNNQGFGVWIDYNQNGSFTDAGELVYTGLLTGTTLTTSGNIVVPMTATAGNTRMRVRSSFSSAPVLADACSNLSYSETEDYKVNILLASSMAYTSSTTTQITGNTFINSTNQQIIGIQVVTTGTSSPLTVTDIALNTTGTTNQATDITNAKLFYTGISNTFATTTQFGTTVAAPVDAYNIAGSQNLLEGTNYFWLTYDIPPGATGGNYIDAECTQITIGSTYVPTITAPTGNRLIAGTMSGSYAIGSGVFNKVTGKNLHQVEKTRTAKVLVPVEEKDSEIRYEERLVEEKYYEMYEGDKPYSGKLVASIGTNQTKNGDPRMSPDYTEVFADISTAINNLNARGITGAIVFELTDASYSTGAVTINAITGASATNTITFKPQAGETVSITGSSATGIFNLNGSDYVIFDGSNSGGTDRSLTITNTNVGSTYAINFSGTGNDYNTIKNCNINSEYRGINIANANTTLIENNNIYGNAAGNLNYSQAGIYIGTGSLNTTVSKNVIHDYYYTGTGGWGAFGVIYASDATTVTQISNNLFYNLLGGGDPGSITYNTSGIFISTGGNVKIYNNSIYMLGDVLGAGTYSGWSSCISINSGITLLDIRNNALRNSMGRIAAGTTAPLLYVIYSLSANTAYTDINYNDYYFTDQASVTEYLGYLGVNCANLTAWAAATGKDGYSVSGNPGFTSA